MNVLCTFNLCPVSTAMLINKIHLTVIKIILVFNREIVADLHAMKQYSINLFSTNVPLLYLLKPRKFSDVFGDIEVEHWLKIA